MKKILSVLALALLAACSKNNEYLPPDFNQPIPDVPVTANIAVGAYYYNYSTADWAKKYADTPVLGTYSALKAETMAQHRTWADIGGVDFFVFNWNGAAAGNPLLNSFITGRNEAVKMVISYNTAHLNATNASPLTGAKLATMQQEISTLAAAHFDRDYYYHLNGKPVMMITPLNLSANAAASINHAEVARSIREMLQNAGTDVYIIGDITSGWLPPQRYAPAVKAMDAVVLNNWATDNYDRYNFFTSYSNINWQNWRDSTLAWQSVDFVPCVFPGYNDKVISPTSKIYDIERSLEFYREYCNVAKLNMSEKRLVLINSWNNFQVGTALEPAVEYGEAYLQATRQNFKLPK
ncbi:glycoside hydrolase family 99-like domain-containing protein [Chitinophaga sp.]|uniref:glycoside hydrolase family 99-like domain-containing protein n=1 Tax=Chitinophaga sp. TaxID=1869181 RepID=UPI0031E065A4